MSSKALETSFAVKWTPRFTAAVALSGLTYLARHALTPPHEALVTFAGLPLKEVYTGMQTIDTILAKLVSAFSFLIQSEDPAVHVQLRYFAPLLGAAILIWTIEGWRTGHRHVDSNQPLNYRLLTNPRPSTFLAAGQLFGIGLVTPIYFILGIMTDDDQLLSQSVRPGIVKAVLPAVAFGYFLPCLAMTQPMDDIDLKQNVIAFWQGSPVYAGVLTTFFAAFLERLATKRASSEAESSPKSQKRGDNPADRGLLWLKLTYSVAFAGFALNHVAIISEILSKPELSLRRIFLDLPHPLGRWDMNDPTEAMFIFMKFDLLSFSLSVLVYLQYSIWNLKILGAISGTQAVRAACIILLGQVLVGPAATYAGVWFWREKAVAARKKALHRGGEVQI